MALTELLWAFRVLGPRHLFTLWQARRSYLELVPGHYAARAIGALLEVGFFDELRSRRVVNGDAFAASHELDAEILRALADYLGALSMLDSDAGNYILRPKGHAIIETMRGAVDLTRAFEDPLHCLVPLLQRTMAYGADVHKDPRLVARASGVGGRLFSHPLMIDLIDRRGFTHVLDLACGDGAFLVSLCRALAGTTAYGIDCSPEAIEDGCRSIRDTNLDGRIHLFAGDVFQADVVARRLPEIDVVTSLYGFEQFLTLGRETIVALLWKWRALFPHATFLVCELLRREVEHLRRHRGGMAELQLGQALVRQRFAADQEWMETWRVAGFRRIERRRFDFAHTAIYILDW